MAPSDRGARCRMLDRTPPRSAPITSRTEPRVRTLLTFVVVELARTYETSGMFDFGYGARK
jgi:hypothetical protein